MSNQVCSVHGTSCPGNAPVSQAGDNSTASACILRKEPQSLLMQFNLALPMGSPAFMNTFKETLDQLTPEELSHLIYHLGCHQQTVQQSLREESMQTLAAVPSVAAPKASLPTPRPAVPPAPAPPVPNVAVSVKTTVTPVPKVVTPAPKAVHPLFQKTFADYKTNFKPILDSLLKEELNVSPSSIKPSVRFQNLKTLEAFHAKIVPLMNVTRADRFFIKNDRHKLLELSQLMMRELIEQPHTLRLLPLLVRSKRLAVLFKSSWTKPSDSNVASIDLWSALTGNFVSHDIEEMRNLLTRLSQEVTAESQSFYRDFRDACHFMLLILVYLSLRWFSKMSPPNHAQVGSCKYDSLRAVFHSVMVENDNTLKANNHYHFTRPTYDNEEPISESLQYDLATVTLKDLIRLAKDDDLMTPHQLEQVKLMTSVHNKIREDPNLLIMRLFVCPLILISLQSKNDTHASPAAVTVAPAPQQPNAVAQSSTAGTLILNVTELYPDLYKDAVIPAFLIKQDPSLNSASNKKASNKRSVETTLAVEDTVVSSPSDDAVMPPLLKKIKAEPSDIPSLE